ncbi:MAG: hypothetical protein Q6358_03080 [Candidatus Brocadiales bacterium]|nr:hypothetical protein [Candidatus Brocadiales bacterium]
MRADSWILHHLPEQLVADWYNLLIFNEYDMQVATYWLRREFEHTRSDTWTVRTQPTLEMSGGKTVKPDIVVFKNNVPYDVLELKCHLDGVRETLLDDDLDKLRRLKRRWNLRHAYQLVLYDDEDVWSLTYDKEPWMRQYLTFVGANVRLHESGRLRRGYDNARGRWEQWK